MNEQNQSEHVLFSAIDSYSYSFLFKNVQKRIKKMNFFAVYLQCKRFIAIKSDWVENAMVGNPSKIFYSENQNAIADFSTSPLYYLNKSINACYEAFVYKSFGKFLMKFFFSNHQ